MSDNHDTPVVLGPPRRGSRRLGARPLIAAAACGVGVVAVAGWVIHSTHRARESVTATAPASQGSGDVDGLLSSMPTHGEIPSKRAAIPAAMAMPVSVPAPRLPTAEPAAPATSPTAQLPAPDDIRRQALRDAWTQYYQQLGQMRRERQDEARRALSADVATGTGAGSSAPSADGMAVATARQNATQAQATALAGSSGGGMGMGVGQEGGSGRPRLPGSLHQGPSSPQSDYLGQTVAPPVGRFVLNAGHLIPIRFVTGVSSDAPGQFRAVVTSHVSDTATGERILIPQGAWIIGTYDQMLLQGSERLPAGATRVIYPGESGETLALGSMPLADQAGYAGLHDQVDRHYGRLVFNTALIALGGAGAQLTQPRSTSGGTIDSGQILAASLGLQFGQLSAEYARNQLQTKPTHTIRPGYTGTLQLTQDVAFPGEWIEGVGMLPTTRRR